GEALAGEVGIGGAAGPDPVDGVAPRREQAGIGEGGEEMPAEGEDILPWQEILEPDIAVGIEAGTEGGGAPPGIARRQPPEPGGPARARRWAGGGGSGRDGAGACPFIRARLSRGRRGRPGVRGRRAN